MNTKAPIDLDNIDNYIFIALNMTPIIDFLVGGSKTLPGPFDLRQEAVVEAALPSLVEAALDWAQAAHHDGCLDPL